MFAATPAGKQGGTVILFLQSSRISITYIDDKRNPSLLFYENVSFHDALYLQLSKKTFNCGQERICV